MLFFFFKQKTAYEMRISDWSSDVCSSDLHERLASHPAGAPAACQERAPAPRRADRATSGERVAGPDPRRKARPAVRSHLDGNAARAGLAGARRGPGQRRTNAPGGGGTLSFSNSAFSPGATHACRPQAVVPALVAGTHLPRPIIESSLGRFRRAPDRKSTRLNSSH